MSDSPTPYDLVIADLEAKRDQINAAIEMLRALSSTAIALPLPMAPQRALPDSEITKDAFFGMTIPEAARKYLSIVKVAKSNPELCEALLKGGFKTQSANFTEVVRSTLQRNPDFVKVHGEWGLAEWYAGRGGARRIKRSDAQNNVAETEQPSEASPDGSSA